MASAAGVPSSPPLSCFPLLLANQPSCPPNSPIKRAQAPAFYGYVPDGQRPRAICFGSLVFISSYMLAIKSLSLVLLSTVSLKYVLLFFAIDITVYLLLKVCACESQNDELRESIHGLRTSAATMSVHNIAAGDSAAISNITNTSFLTTRFARRRSFAKTLSTGCLSKARRSR